MKKLLAMLLILAMLVPMGVVAQAEGAEKKGFYMINWSGSEKQREYVYDMPYLWTYKSKLEQGELAPVLLGDTYEIPAGAATIKEMMDDRPEGTRHLNFTLPQSAFHHFAEDACIIVKAVPVIQMWLKAFLAEYKKIGGKLDGLVVDVEYFDLSYYYIHSNYFTKDPMIYDKITKNTVYKEEIRPKLVERGFKFYSPVSENTPEIYSLHPNSGAEYAESRSIWDAVMRSHLNGCITEGCSPLWDYYPDAVVSDYTSKDVKPWLKEVGDSGGAGSAGGNLTTAGNSNNENFYSVRPWTSFYRSNKGPVYNSIPTYNKSVYEESPFTMFLYDDTVAKNTYLAADNGHVSWWIAHYLYALDNPKSVSNTPYYAETLLHIGMLNPDYYLGYILQNEVVGIVKKVYGEELEKLDNKEGYESAEDYGVYKYETALTIVNDCLKELTRVVGYADRKAIAVNPNMNSQFVLSGMYANGKNYWRITPDTSKVALENFKVKDAADPTFFVGGETVTFPGGKIIEDGKITDIGTCGYWVETSKDVTPTVTRPVDYYRQYPAYQETFESFKPGTSYDYNNALPEACWEQKKQGSGSGTVIADPANADNQVLEMKGTYSLKNMVMPQNIIAGDTYAERQAWEVTVTLPSDMADNAEVVLLNAVPEKKKATDGGFKIQGTKVYYSQDGEYVEMAGVTLTAGVKYTLLRKMNFTAADAITSDYYVYDAAGNVVGKAKNIAVSKQDLPIYGVNLSVKNVTGGAVLLDDYKLYQDSVATDFYLYDQKTGMEIKEIDKAYNGNVVYRLSWMNATKTEKSYTVMAAFYNGDTLVTEKAVQELKMTPGTEDVLIGTVEVTEGQTVKVYLKDNNPPEQDDDEFAPGGDGTKDPAGDGLQLDPMIIIIAAAAVVMIAVVVVVIVVVSKKKKKVAASAEEVTPVETETTEEKPEE